MVRYTILLTTTKHLLGLNSMEFIELFTYYEEAVMAEIDSISIYIDSQEDDKYKIYDAYYNGLGMPGYQRNWDAFLDFLRDLEWVKTKNVYVVHRRLPSLVADDMQIYIEILYDALCSRHVNGAQDSTNLVIMFNSMDRAYVNRMLLRYIKRKKSSPHYTRHSLGYY